jgi:hypothetical protein
MGCALSRCWYRKKITKAPKKLPPLPMSPTSSQSSPVLKKFLKPPHAMLLAIPKLREEEKRTFSRNLRRQRDAIDAQLKHLESIMTQ